MQENIKQVIVKNTVRKEFKTAPIWQWDTGHVLVFEGFNLPEAFQVHFAFSESGESVPQIGSNDQVTVPDALVEDGRMIYAWLYILTEDAGLTKFVILMPVNRRAKPTHQVPPPVEHSEIEQAIVVLNAAVVRTETAAENAEQSEENASQYADNAYHSSEAAASAAESAEGDARTATQKAQEALTAALDADRKAQNASESAQLASQKASEASGYADGLAEAVRTANEAKQTAVNKATEATQSATNAAQKAQEALSSAQAAEGSANDADTAKRGAETAKEAAQGYAGNASIMAQEASQSKDTAVEKAGEASQSATAAAQSATAAQQTAAQFEEDITSLKSDIESKQDAPAVAGTEGQVLSLDGQGNPIWATVQTESEIDDTAGKGDTDKAWSADKLVSELQDKADVIISSASGAIASFPDGSEAPVKKLVVTVEPVQDLHGYDSPWPGGGGKNKLNIDAIQGNSKIVINNGVMTVTTTEQRDNETTTVPFSSFANLVVGETYILTFDTTYTGGQYIYLRGTSEIWNIGNSKTITQAMLDGFVSFYAGIGKTATITNLMIRLASESDSSYTPYSNECPISGWTGANVQRTGKNLLDNVNPVYLNGYFNSATVSANNNNRILIMPCAPNTAYAFTYNRVAISGTQTARIVSFESLPTYGTVGTMKAANVNESASATFTTGANDKYIGIHLGDIRSTDVSASVTASQLELGSATAYEPYSGQTIQVEFPSEAGTVYGGTLTVNGDGTGNVVVEKVLYTIPPNKIYKPGSAWCYSDAFRTEFGKTKNFTPDMCNLFKIGLYAQLSGSTPIIAIENGGYLYIGWDNINQVVGDTQAKSQQYFTDNPLKILFKLNEPQTYTLTAEQISGILSTLKGMNNIWADAGDVEVTYRADTKLYIDNKITAAVAAALNS